MSWPFKAARNFYRGRQGHVPRLIVVHDMEAPEGPHTAENVAAYFAGAKAPKASAHFCVDRDSIVQCVGAGDTAWAAPGANNDGLHIEHAGFARQSRGQWLADEPLLNLSSCVAAELVVGLHRFGVEVPIARLGVGDVAGGRARGFCGHLDVTRAFHRSTHTDPGDGFPWDVWLAKVRWWVPNVHRLDFR